MLFPLTLPQAAHELAESVVAWQAELVDSLPPSVKLTASIQSDPAIPISPIQGPTATSVAIRMDARVAIDLYEKLGELGRSMGWLPQSLA
jgi:hypothetical protein